MVIPAKVHIYTSVNYELGEELKDSIYFVYMKFDTNEIIKIIENKEKKSFQEVKGDNVEVLEEVNTELNMIQFSNEFPKLGDIYSLPEKIYIIEYNKVSEIYDKFETCIIYLNKSTGEILLNPEETLKSKMEKEEITDFYDLCCTTFMKCKSYYFKRDEDYCHIYLEYLEDFEIDKEKEDIIIYHINYLNENEYFQSCVPSFKGFYNQLPKENTNDTGIRFTHDLLNFLEETSEKINELDKPIDLDKMFFDYIKKLVK